MIEAVTLDFGNTLVPVSGAALAGVVAVTTHRMATRLGPFDADMVRSVWAEERDRQFREEVPQGREVDMAQRIVRILARVRGMAPPSPEQRWDDEAAARLSEPGEIGWVVDEYSAAFVALMPADPAAGAVIAHLAQRYRVAILSNWPVAAAIDRYAEVAGWMPHLAAVVVSQRVGTIKPHPAIFDAARSALGSPEPSAILHVGDDWAADVVGAKRAGWRAAWLSERPPDSPLPGSERDESVTADLVLRSIADVGPGLTRLEGAGG